MVGADVHLRLSHTYILDKYKAFKPLVCCLKGVWVQSHTVTLAKLAPDLGSQGHLWSENDATTSWVRLISTSDHFIHPYLAYKVFETFVCCLKGIWLHTYTITTAKLPPDLGIRVHLRR